MRKRVLSALGAGILLTAAPRLAGQEPPPGPCVPVEARVRSLFLAGADVDVARLLEITGRARIRPRLITSGSEEATATLCAPAPAPLRGRVVPYDTAAGLSWELLPLAAGSHFNSAYPRDANNGALWAGRGWSAEVSAGARLRWGPLSAAAAPVAILEQNRDFATTRIEIPGYSEHANADYPGIIDLPQRFGERSRRSLSPGQSYVRLDAFGVAAGLSTENLRIGPAMRNPLLLSYTAAGFPHAFAGTSRPAETLIGQFEVRAVVGRLRESDYFDFDPANDRRIFGALELAYGPPGLDGLWLGAARVYTEVVPPAGARSGAWIDALVDLPFSKQAGNKPGNAIAALFARWVLPESGFEVYAEWGRDDYTWDLETFIKEPDHSQAYALGFQKVLTSPGQWVRIAGELTHLEAAIPLRSGQGAIAFYTAGTIDAIQGHTHRGQLLGASIGPGSDAQYLAVDVFRGWGSAGAYVERIRHSTDAYFATWGRYFGVHGHDVELTAGVRQSLHWRDLLLHADLSLARRVNRDFVGLDPSVLEFPVERNVGLRLGAAWWPRTGAEPAPLPAAAPAPAPPRP